MLKPAHRTLSSINVAQPPAGSTRPLSLKLRSNSHNFLSSAELVFSCFYEMKLVLYLIEHVYKEVSQHYFSVTYNFLAHYFYILFLFKYFLISLVIFLIRIWLTLTCCCISTRLTVPAALLLYRLIPTLLRLEKHSLCNSCYLKFIDFFVT